MAKARELGVHVLALADHDTTAGYQSIRQQPDLLHDLRVIPAIEISAEGESPCHLLGYFVDVENAPFQRALVQHRAWRETRVQAMIEKLRTLGYPLERSDVRASSAAGSIGRPHVADALRTKGYVRSRQEAFDRFLRRDGPAFVPTVHPSTADCIALIRNAKGIPVLAHPAEYGSIEFVKKLVDWGLMGIEAYYPEHSRALTARFVEMATTFNLVVTGGSDFHGPRTGRPRLACVDVPERVLQDLERARGMAS